MEKKEKKKIIPHTFTLFTETHRNKPTHTYTNIKQTKQTHIIQISVQGILILKANMKMDFTRNMHRKEHLRCEFSQCLYSMAVSLTALNPCSHMKPAGHKLYVDKFASHSVCHHSTFRWCVQKTQDDWSSLILCVTASFPTLKKIQWFMFLFLKCIMKQTPLFKGLRYDVAI